MSPPADVVDVCQTAGAARLARMPASKPMPRKAKLHETSPGAPVHPADATRRPPLDERTKLIGAATAVIDRDGAPAADVDSICARAHLPRSSFRAGFHDREDCLLAVFDALAEVVLARARDAFLSGTQWVDGTRRATHVLLALVEAHPLLARFMLIEPCRSEPQLIPRLAWLELSLTEALIGARPTPCSPAPGAYGPRASVGAAFAVLHTRLAEEPVPPLAELVPPLMGMLVLPYLGTEGSRRELTRGRFRG